MPGIFALLTLDVTALLNGQIWRVVSWLLVPPDGGSNLFFVAIMLFFYYSIGTSLERVWGDFKYNVFIFLNLSDCPECSGLVCAGQAHRRSYAG